MGPAVSKEDRPQDRARRSSKPKLANDLERLSKRIYRLLGLSGYARLDYRLNKFGTFYLLEANPNPQIARDEDFAQSAKHAGMGYEELLQKLVTLGIELHAESLTRA